jgi:CheY-like chemotaxis protein
MEAIGLMAGGVAHDLNNILSGVISYPELMMLKLPQDSPVQEDLKKVVASGQRAAGVVADLLTVARGAATVKEVACLNELIKSYMTSPEFCKLSSLYPLVTFIPSLTPGVATISCSPGHIQKMLMNLVTNAAEAIDENGEVRVSTCSHVVSDKDSLHDIMPGNYTVLQVTDTGTGISRYDQEHIFDPFYTTKKMGRSGTGLGLAVVWNTAQDHGGHVTVESDDRGTSFIIYLPVSPETHTCKMPPSKSSLEELHGKGKLLVVDDEKNQREIAVKILSVLGYEVSAVSSGEDAISFVKHKQPDLVLLDMLMDPGLNGRQTYERIFRRFPDQKAIVVSGYSESEDINKLMEMGVLGLLKKPYTMEKMGLIVKQALQGKA